MEITLTVISLYDSYEAMLMMYIVYVNGNNIKATIYGINLKWVRVHMSLYYSRITS